MAWARNGTPDTLGSSGDTLEITDLTARKFNQFLTHNIKAVTAGNLAPILQFNANGNTDYAYRHSQNGGADSTQTSLTYIYTGLTHDSDFFIVTYSINIDSEEKLVTGFVCNRNDTTATNAPQRTEFVGKMGTATVSGQYTQASWDNSGTSDYDTGTNMSALTGDETETVTLQNGTIFEETDTNKAYIWNSSTKTWTQL